MALILADRVKETTTTTGTGTLSLAGAVAGFQSFAAGVGTANTTYYAITDSATGDWEVGIGTVTSGSPDTLSRDTVLESSNSDNLVNFGVGQKTVICTQPAEKAVYLDASDQLVIDGTSVTATAAELNYVDGVTSAIQTQLNAKAPIDNATFTGTTTIPTADINGGTIDGVTIGGASAGAGTFTTITADGLDVDGTNQIQFSAGKTAYVTGSPSPFIYRTGTASGSEPFNVFGNFVIQARSNAAASFYVVTGVTPRNRLRISDSGNISFYEDTGTTPKLFWNASAESLGIGTTSPSEKISIDDSGLTSNSNSRLIALSGGRPSDRYAAIGVEKEGTSNQIGMTFYTTNNAATPTERVRIDANGNVGIGTTSPATTLDVTGTITADGLTVEQATSPTITISSTKNGTWTAGEVLGNILFDGDDASGEGAATKVSLVAESKDTFGAAFDLAIKTTDGTNGINTALKILHNNDLELYEDTGTTPKFFWDASTERLGIGNVAPTTALDVTGTVTADGLSVDGDVTITQSSGGTFLKFDVDGTADEATLGIDSTDFVISNDPTNVRFGSDIVFKTDGITAAKVRASGDFELYEDTGTTAQLTWDASDEELIFKDNVKAEFGDGGDLQISHNGTNNSINGFTGQLQIANYANDNDVRILTDDGSGGATDYFKAQGSTGEVQLYHYGAEKLATKSTGVDVTGTVTADDEIIVDGDSGAQVTIRDTGRSGLQLSQNNTGGGVIDLVDASENLHIRTQSTNNIRIQSSGDISFYEDSGTSENFYWDASTSRLGLGTTTPSGVIHAVSSGVSNFVFQGSDVGEGTLFQIRNGTNNSATGNGHRLEFVHGNTDSRNVFFRTSSTGTFGRSPDLYIGSQNDSGGAELDHVRIYAGGDVSFYNDDSTSQDFYWDASTSRLGLGTTTPDTVMEVVSDDPILTIRDSSTALANSSSTLRLAESAADDALGAYWDVALDGSGGTIDFTIGNNTSEAMRIDSLGNVGIGTTSPETMLHLSSSSGSIIRLQDQDASAESNSLIGALEFYSLESENVGEGVKAAVRGYNSSNNGNGELRFYTGNTTSNDNEVMRLESGGNLLVGRTSFGYSGNGHAIRPALSAVFNRDGGTAIIANRNTSDGGIVDFLKDGTTVGSIGVVTDDNLYLQGNSSHVGLAFGSSSITPFKNQAYVNDTVDLGGSTYQWKDLYLSGGVRADTLKFSSLAGSEYGRFDSSGRLGIGTTSPDGLLHIDGTSATVTGLVLEAGANADCRSIDFQNNTGDKRFGFSYDNANIKLSVTDRSENKLITFQENGNVGIGTSSPGGKLDVNNGGGAYIRFFDEQSRGIQINQADPLLSLRDLDATGTPLCDISGSGGILSLRADAGNETASSAIQFTVDGSEAMRIDSSGNVGIGTTTPLAPLQVHYTSATPSTSAGDAGLVLRGSSSLRTLFGSDPASPFSGWIQNTNESGTSSLPISLNPVGGNVGIGTTSPNRNLHVIGNATIEATTGNSAFLFVPTDTDNRLYSRAGNASNTPLPLTFFTGGSEAMRIDNSGNLLVGTTDSSPENNSSGTSADDGIALMNAGYISACNYGAASLFLNRTSTDGDIVDFRKDGTTVGSIGVDNTDNIFLSGNSSHSGLMVGTDSIVPYANGNTSDATEDLGASSIRWRNLYLSGGVYLGGTGSANLLDDYEEGVSTADATQLTINYTYASKVGAYTKIGDTVIYTFRYEWTTTNKGSGDTVFSSLPFVASADGYVHLTECNANISADQIYGKVISGTDDFKIYGRNNASTTLVGPVQKGAWTTGGFANVIAGVAIYKT